MSNSDIENSREHDVSKQTRRRFLKRSGGATAASVVAWHQLSLSAAASPEDPTSGSSGFGVQAISPQGDNNNPPWAHTEVQPPWSGLNDIKAGFKDSAGEWTSGWPKVVKWKSHSLIRTTQSNAWANGQLNLKPNKKDCLTIEYELEWILYQPETNPEVVVARICRRYTRFVDLWPIENIPPVLGAEAEIIVPGIPAKVGHELDTLNDDVTIEDVDLHCEWLITEEPESTDTDNSLWKSISTEWAGEMSAAKNLVVKDLLEDWVGQPGAGETYAIEDWEDAFDKSQDFFDQKFLTERGDNEEGSYCTIPTEGNPAKCSAD